ncbi:hypothetical protein HA402_000248 [Bradysia odoriphaga]|nr:hypothetical protein HA402_000248 [Bradysia odoriphaga]
MNAFRGEVKVNILRNGNFPWVASDECNDNFPDAPPGYLIKLDFRNKFNIEPSNGCEYDFLEIRDGKHGYSKELGKFCGTDFPPIIFSSQRYLWLHFHSDENIEYDGFQAVYEFMEQSTASYSQEIECQFMKDGKEGFVNRTEISDDLVNTVIQNSLNLDCLWVIEVEHGWRILLSFLTFELDRKNDCDSNFIDVFGEITEIPKRLKNFCGVIAETVVSKENKMHIRFFAETHAVHSDFSILYTAYRQKDKEKKCVEGEYDCDDDTCIKDGLKCNGRPNCKFLKDESEAECKKENAGKEDQLVIIIIVFSLILGAMTTAFLVNCIRKLIRDQKIIREHIRQSKESKLDEAGRMSLKRSLENINRIAPRESLFAPVFKNKITQAPNNQPPGTIRFSTFGYDTPPGEKTLHRQSIHKDKCRMQPNTIEMEDFGHLTDIPPPPPKVCQKHDPKKSIKMEESRIYVDIRNSAPDVIIMTSH